MKSYRIVRIAGLTYTAPMLEFYEKNPEITAYPYKTQQRMLFDRSYVYSDSFSQAMRSLGHEAHEIVYDLKPMQKTWARENGIRCSNDHWQHEIILKQIKHFRPDIVFFQDIHSLPYSIRKNLKKEFPFIKLVCVYKGYPGAFRELDDVDVLLAGTPRMVEQFSQAGLCPKLIYHAFDDAILDKIPQNSNAGHEPLYDFTFVGSSGFGHGIGHRSRFWALVDLIEKTNIDLWIDEIVEDDRSEWVYRVYDLLKDGLKTFDTDRLSRMRSLKGVPKRITRLIDKAIKEKTGTAKADDKQLSMPLGKMFPNRCRSPVFGLEMYKVLYRSRITFNRHTDEALDSVGNIRMFQATGMGTCLLTDTGKNMPDLFKEDQEVVTYSSIEECVEKMNYLLEHEDVRRNIAAAGQQRTLKDHTVQTRCQQIDGILQQRL